MLDLARVVAHAVNLSAASLTSFLLGCAVGGGQPLAKPPPSSSSWPVSGRGGHRLRAGSLISGQPSGRAGYRVNGDVLAAHELGLTAGDPPPGIGSRESADRPAPCLPGVAMTAAGYLILIGVIVGLAMTLYKPKDMLGLRPKGRRGDEPSGVAG